MEDRQQRQETQQDQRDAFESSAHRFDSQFAPMIVAS